MLMKETILVVDDTPTNLQVMVGFLAAHGYRTIIAEDGTEAVEQVVRSRPDMILLDVAMPEMDGFEACRRIKALPGAKEIPVLFLTARTEISDKLKGFEVGAVDYITKPIQKEEVIARVETHLLLVEQKRQVQAMLEQRQRFMRIAAHDLRNLLAVVSGYAEFGLVKANGQQDLAGAFGRIRDAGLHMKAIIDEFLALRLLEQAGEGKTDRFQLEQVLLQLVDQSRFAAQAKGINLASDLPHGAMPARGNLAHTHQILTNYFSNAIKYSPRGTRILLAATPRDGLWRVEVRDQGPGVLPAERKDLFVEFAKISNKPTGGETSTGIGLSIVKALAEAQGGRVGAEFPDTGGSIFWLEVPAG